MTGDEFQRRRLQAHESLQEHEGLSLTQRDLARWFDVGKSTIARLETSGDHIKRVYALALLRLQAYPEEYVLWRESQRFEPAW